MHEVLNPPNWVRPKGYSNGIKAEGAMVFTAGVTGWNENEEFVAKDFLGQLKQALINTCAILAEAGAEPKDIVRMTWYITDKDAYGTQQKEIGQIWRETLGRIFPCMACVQVVALVEDEAKVEIETTAVISN